MPETLRLEDAVDGESRAALPVHPALDASGSMHGERIDGLNEGLRTFGRNSTETASLTNESSCNCNIQH